MAELNRCIYLREQRAGDESLPYCKEFEMYCPLDDMPCEYYKEDE